MSENIGLIDAMSTTRAIRKFSSDPIPDDVLHQVLEAATWAPSGGNRQSWRAIVIRDPELRKKVGELYRSGYNARYSAAQRLNARDPSQASVYTSADYLAEHMATEPPVLVLFCNERPSDSGIPSASLSSAWVRGSSVFPAVQNLLLAAREHGLGGCLTTLHMHHEVEIKALLGIPDNVDTFALVPLGYPRVKFGPLRRMPVEQFTYADRWGKCWGVKGNPGR